MGFRFRKRIKIAPGIHINLSKSGISTSLGGKGATLNINKRGIKSTVGIPGTGLSHTSQLAKFATNKPANPSGVKSTSFSSLIKLILLIAFIAWICGAFK